MLPDDYVTVAEAAQYWRVSPWTVRSWLRTRKNGLTKYKAAGKVLISRDQMKAYVKPDDLIAERKTEAVA